MILIKFTETEKVSQPVPILPVDASPPKGEQKMAKHLLRLSHVRRSKNGALELVFIFPTRDEIILNVRALVCFFCIQAKDNEINEKLYCLVISIARLSAPH